MCDYRIPAPWRQTRGCLNAAKWLVEFTTPDDGNAMRKRENRIRCLAHTEERFLPKGATQIVTSLLSSRAYCERCDGCGWYEGGRTIQTRCERCDGTGVAPQPTKPNGAVSHGTNQTPSSSLANSEYFQEPEAQ